MHEGWLIDGSNHWSMCFQQDEKCWVRDQPVFVDMGRGMPDGEPALLKSRRHLRLDEVAHLCFIPMSVCVPFIGWLYPLAYGSCSLP